jgi:hypothetical protein
MAAGARACTRTDGGTGGVVPTPAQCYTGTAWRAAIIDTNCDGASLF